MTITLTAVTKRQWVGVAKVALWVVLSNALAIGLAYVSNNVEFAVAGPAINILGVLVQKIFQTEEEQAIGQLPSSIVQPTQQAVNSVDAAVQAHSPKPNIGSTANS